MSTAPERPKTSTPENEIRVGGRTNVIRFVDRVEEAFKKFDNVTLSGINAGISNVLLITEIVKLKIKDLHQYNFIETVTTEIKEENKEEEQAGDHPRYLTRFKVELHKNKLETPPKGSFYEAPYTEEQITKIKEVKPPEGARDRPQTGRPRGSRRGRGGPRGGRGEGRGRGGSRGEGRGRGGPRGGRGEGRGRGGPRGGRGEGRGRGGRGGPRGGRGEGRGRGQRGEGRGGRGGPRGGKGEGRGGKKQENGGETTNK